MRIILSPAKKMRADTDSFAVRTLPQFIDRADELRAAMQAMPSGVRFLMIVFGGHIGGKIVEKGTFCKMARGEMVRWMAENSIELTEDDRLGCRFRAEESNANTYTFIKGD